MQLFNIFTKFCCKDGNKITPILTTCKKCHNFFPHMIKKLSQILQTCKKLYINFCTLQNNL